MLATAVLGLLSVGLLVSVAPPGRVFAQLGSMRPGWLLAAVTLELGSCFSYPVLFRRFFPEPPRGVSHRVAWISMGAGAVLPGGNFSSAAASGWLLRRYGIATRGLIERCGALLCLLTALGFAVNGAAAVLLLMRVPDGPHDVWRTLGPILVSTAVLSSAALLILVGRRLGGRAWPPVRGLAGTLEAAWRELGRPHWRLLGAAGFLGLDMAALWAACAATGRHIGFLAVVIAYCIGYLATMVPMPAGLGVLDSGLTGSLVIYGMRPAAAVGAVLVYHAIAIWVPGLGGLLAWLPTRRTRRKAREPGLVVGPAPAEAPELAV
jgi:uncharacterized membrane protein YbhN (UPF0104 family)